MRDSPVMVHISETIRKTIEDEILRGELIPGDRLPSEEKLCQRFQASRTVVREAIQQLRGRGLLQTRKGSGSYIANPNLEMLSHAVETFSVLNRGGSYLELIDFRMLLETECARLAATHASPDMIALMQRALDKMNDSRGDRKRFSEADIAFHLAIAAASRHRLFATILTALKKRSIEYASANRGDAPWFQSMITTHQEIFDAIKNGKPEESAIKMAEHLAVSRNTYLERSLPTEE